MPPNQNNGITMAVRDRYIIHSIFAVWAMRGFILCVVGPGASALNNLWPPTPIVGRTATKNTTIPIPPSHCVMLRQKRMPCGRASIFSIMVAPVVVRPLIDSK